MFFKPKLKPTFFSIELPPCIFTLARSSLLEPVVLKCLNLFLKSTKIGFLCSKSRPGLLDFPSRYGTSPQSRNGQDYLDSAGAWLYLRDSLEEQCLEQRNRRKKCRFGPQFIVLKLVMYFSSSYLIIIIIEIGNGINV